MIKKFESMVNSEYIIGIPSGEVIDIEPSDINKLKQEGHISYSTRYSSYIFYDIEYEYIMRLLNKVQRRNNDGVYEFFDGQKGVRNFLIHTDGEIDVSGNLSIVGGVYKSLPFRFKSITGDFIFKDCDLESLYGAPKTVGGNFIVSGNGLFNLENGPTFVGKDYDCSDNFIDSLIGAPKTIRGDFNCEGNFLKNLDGAPKTVEGSFDISNNSLGGTDGVPICSYIITGTKTKKMTFKNNGDGKLTW